MTGTAEVPGKGAADATGAGWSSASTAGEALSGRTVVVAGATSAAGVAVSRRLAAGGARVVSIGSDAGRLEAALGSIPGVDQRVCDLTDAAAVRSLAAQLARDYDGGVSVLVHLVGGWRGGQGIPTQSDEDYAFLHSSVFATLFNTSRAFYDQLAANDGRLTAVSAAAVEHPTASGASYAAVKAGVEAWLRAVADGFGKDGTSAASTVLVVKALVDEDMRRAQPERKFPGFTPVEQLADAIAALVAQPAASVNGRRFTPAELLALAGRDTGPAGG
ncbi:SDR family oxidoreductase [Arthrobacter sp. Br18]|uniref:SDR family NAD(P)-dependent oxidoreductase n=1 Tax=Arthrobacter sp. Br18 TaxID=1312954 RepID=UPI0004B2F3CA|nr:SDR family oxidoreductase [Arthrobacter sp. Br18]